MKFSSKRSKERKEEKRLEKLLKNLSFLNPTGTFKPMPSNSSYISSGLVAKDLASISLPLNATFLENPSRAINNYGFLRISYMNKEYQVFVKGLERPYLAN